MFSGEPLEIRTRRKVVEPRTAAQKAYVRNLFRNELVFGLGPAGTGKTYLAVAAAVAMFIEGHVDRIILSRPAVEAGERLGFLPGDMKEKVDPYMQPLYDALNDFFPPKQVQKLIEEKQIEIAPLAFMRGRTLANAFVVLDEAQNATTMQMKMFLTRLGEGSRMAVTGDITQIDLPRGVTSGLVEAERILQRRGGGRLHPLHRRGRGAPSAGRADHPRLRERPPGRCAEPCWSRRWSRTPRWEAAGIAAVAERAARAALAAVGRDPELHEIGLLACDDARIAALNAEFRGKAAPTNVLSWPAFTGPVPEEPPGCRGEGPLFLGDLALAYETCARGGRGGGHPARRPRGASGRARRAAPARPRPRGGRRGRGDGGARDESACQHGGGEPIFGRGAPLRRGIRTGDDGRDTGRACGDGPGVSEDDDPDSPARPSFFSRLFRRDASARRTSGRSSGRRRIRPARRGAREMLVNLRSIRRMRVDDVSVPRADIVAVSEHATLEELVAVFQSSTLSRLPVYAETLDQPRRAGAPQGRGAELRLRRDRRRTSTCAGLLRPLLYAPPSMPIGVLLQKMQAARIHMALVIDEYGGVDGLVTIEDLLEQIVGEIADEHDEDEGELWTAEAPGVFLAQARMDLEDFEGAAGRAAGRSRASPRRSTRSAAWSSGSPAGCRRAARWCAHPDGHEFEVVDADARRIKRLRVRLEAGGAPRPRRSRPASAGGDRRVGRGGSPRWRARARLALAAAAGAALALAQPPVSLPAGALPGAAAAALAARRRGAAARGGFRGRLGGGGRLLRRGAVLDRRAVPGRAARSSAGWRRSRWSAWRAGWRCSGAAAFALARARWPPGLRRVLALAALWSACRLCAGACADRLSLGAAGLCLDRDAGDPGRGAGRAARARAR